MRSMLKRRRAEETKEQPVEAPQAFMAVSKAAAQRNVDQGKPPWFVTRPHIENAVLRLHEEMLDFVDFMQHTREEVNARRKWVQTIKEACVALWPACRVTIFGSFFTGLSLPNGDVDVAVSEIPCKTSTAMKMLADHLLSKGHISWLEIIETAKVPVIKVRSQACGLRADIVFSQPDGIESSKFIRSKVKQYPQMKPLLLFLKYFLLQRGLHETYTGGMGSYLLCNVVLHFLQRHPSLKHGRQYSGTSLGHLLFDFLRYYGQEFNYSQGVSVLEGGAIFAKGERFPNSEKKRGPPTGVTLCVESPLTPAMDLGAACFRMPVLRNLFHHGFHCLCHLFVSRSPSESSMLCPLLIDPQHPVITDRFKLMAVQPSAFPGAKPGNEPEPEAEAQPEKKRRRENWIPSLVGANNRTVQDYAKGNLENVLAPSRTSWSCMMRYAQDSVVERLEHRLLAMAPQLPMANLERMNAVRYAPGEYFNEHHDGKFRPLTIFVYLNNLEEDDDAGDTYFPYLGLSFRPRRGTALVWPNSVNGAEDGRVLHAGRAPKLGVKYGVNCFFNVNPMRHMRPDLQEYSLEGSTKVDVRSLGSSENDGKLVAYQLCMAPKLVAVKSFLSDEEVNHFLGLASHAREAPVSGAFCGATQTLRILSQEETETVAEVEARLAATSGLPLGHLAPLRIVRTASDRGLSNRGCGPKSVYVCLSETDEVFFYRLGLRLKMRRGDALLWPNVEWKGEDPIEDLRTVRLHLPAGPSDEQRALGLDAFFHDTDIRTQQKLRTFQRESQAA
ncbi:unnamed protein product [Effrenium voratum]|nr:unnamed protein product [Effrenium voratum]